MKKLVLFLLSSLIVLSFSTVVCAEGGYVSGNIGVAILPDLDVTEPGLAYDVESEAGMALGIALGYGYSNDIRVEVELAYQKNDADEVNLYGVGLSAGGETSCLAVLLNGYYDFTNNSGFTPFVSAGIGYAKVEVDDFSVLGTLIGSADDKVFAYQIGAGVGFAVSEEVTLDFKYRFFGTADADLGATETEFASHNFYVGLRLSF